MRRHPGGYTCGTQVRRKLVGDKKPSYSQYTCYTGISDFTPPDIDTVGCGSPATQTRNVVAEISPLAAAQLPCDLESSASFDRDMAAWLCLEAFSQGEYRTAAGTSTAQAAPADRRYRVFLGNGRYFVSSDVGGGKMQWYAFHKEAAGGTDQEGQQKARLLEIFGDWAGA